MNNWLEREARRLNKARRLLEPGLAGCGGVWADLGCGDGVFTYWLHMLLAPGSTIYAVDKDRQALRQMRQHLAESVPEAAVQPVLADFSQPLSLPPLDGLLLANSLHFINTKETVLSRLAALLKPGGRLLVIEYNTGRGNYAVPYPLAEADFLALAGRVGLVEARIVAKAPSSFLGEMYTGLALARG
jgi:ubiquinone/menaquinone biosynthesis C-methylase UbiE